MAGLQLQRYQEGGKNIDRAICDALKKGLSIEEQIDEENKDFQIVMQVKREFDRRKNMIISLFDGDFEENEQLVKGTTSNNKNQELDFYEKIAIKILKRQVDRIFGTVLKGFPQDSIELDVGCERKLFIDQVIDKNLNFDLRKMKNKSDEGR